MNSLSMSMLETQKNILRNILNILKMKKESNNFILFTFRYFSRNEIIDSFLLNLYVISFLSYLKCLICIQILRDRIFFLYDIEILLPFFLQNI